MDQSRKQRNAPVVPTELDKLSISVYTPNYEGILTSTKPGSIVRDCRDLCVLECAQSLRATQFNLLVASALASEATVTQLAEALVMDRTTLTRNLKPLESQGLLTINAGTDRRKHLVRLTERGRQALATALPYWEQAQDRVVTRLGQPQWHTLLAELKTVVTLAPQF